MTVQTQWRAGSMGGVIGLDYVAVEAAIRMSDFKITPEVFRGLQIMETAATNAMSEKNNG